MFKKPLTVLGINPGSRYLGIAAFRGPELRDWGIKVLQGKQPKERREKIKKIVSGLVDQYDPDALAIKKLHPSRSSLNLNRLVAEIRGLAQRKDLRVHQYSIGALERAFSPEGSANKRQMVELIASQYPVLFSELNKEKAHKNPYHVRMFEAVALGSVCFYQLDQHRSTCQRTTQKS